ncbi:hypothetical protein J4434_01405 [Candidatus Woesearchaeota archaeon]|nr:hypothetical protein [Candidatus Woesearchaeota archaeon]
MIKASKVVFISDELEKEFNSLANDDPIKKSITKAIYILKENAFAGIHIPKKIIPSEYIKRYGINNLWKYNLIKGWRLIYTVTSDNEVELITAVLEWFDHKRYERRFKY